MLPPAAKISERLPQRVAKNSTAVFVGQALSLAANLGVTVLLARHLGQAGFGLFSYALVFISFFSMIVDLSVHAILVRELSRQNWSVAELVGNAVFMKAILSFVAIALANAVAGMAGYAEPLPKMIMILSFGVLLASKYSGLRMTFEAPFNASLKMHIPMLCQLIDSILVIVVTFVLTRSGADLTTLVVGYSLSSLPGLLLIIVASRREARWRVALNPRLLRFLLRESFPLWIYFILTTLFNGLDVLFIREYHSESAVGLYSAATRLTTPLLFLPHAVSVSLLPLLSRYYEQADAKLSLVFHLGMKVTMLMALALAIATTFLAPDIIRLLYSSAYGASAAPLVLLMWSQAFLFLNFFFANVLTAVNQQRAASYAAAAMLITNALANLILIPQFGIVGAAWAKLVASIGVVVLLFASVGKTFALRLPQLLPRVAIVGAAFACGVALLSQTHLAISLLGAIAIFPLLALLAGVFNKEEIVVLRSMIPSAARQTS